MPKKTDSVPTWAKDVVWYQNAQLFEPSQKQRSNARCAKGARGSGLPSVRRLQLPAREDLAENVTAILGLSDLCQASNQ